MNRLSDERFDAWQWCDVRILETVDAHLGELPARRVLATYRQGVFHFTLDQWWGLRGEQAFALAGAVGNGEYQAVARTVLLLPPACRSAIREEKGVFVTELQEAALFLVGFGVLGTWMGWTSWTRRTRFIDYRGMASLPIGLMLLCWGIAIMLPLSIGIPVGMIGVAFGVWMFVMIIFALPGLNYRVGYPRWFREHERAKEQRR